MPKRTVRPLLITIHRPAGQQDSSLDQQMLQMTLSQLLG